MHSVSLVQDIGEALPEHPSIKYRANSALHMRNMEELLACVSGFMNEIGLPATLSVNDINTYFNLMTQNRAFGVHGTTPGNGIQKSSLKAAFTTGPRSSRSRRPRRRRKYSPSM
jgi:hypothetical protein